MITVYVKPSNCRYCEAVKARLAKENIKFETRFIDGEVLELALDKGWKAAPIVLSTEHPELAFAGGSQEHLDAFVEAHKP